MNRFARMQDMKKTQQIILLRISTLICFPRQLIQLQFVITLDHVRTYKHIEIVQYRLIKNLEYKHYYKKSFKTIIYTLPQHFQPSLN